MDEKNQTILNNWISQFQQTEFIFRGVNWWPLLKIQVCYQWHLFCNQVHKDYPIIEDTLPGGQKQSATRFYWPFVQRKKYSAKKVAVITDNKNATTPFEGQTINIYTQPFLEEFERQQIDCDVFDISGSTLWNSFDLHQEKSSRKPHIIYELNQQHAFRKQVRELSDALKSETAGALNLYGFLLNQVVNNEIQYECFKEFFKGSRFEVVLLYCYYNNTMQAITRAARLLNLNVVEYQHSQIGSGHPAYSQWATQSKKSDFFPSTFWAWRKQDADYITKSWQGCTNCMTIPGGHLFLNYFKPNSAKASSENKVLISLQGIGLPDFVQEVMVQSNQIHFYLKQHPRYPDNAAWMHDLKSKNPEFIHTQAVNTQSLYEACQDKQFHMTAYSGSALEAEYFGLQNIIFGEKGRKAYQAEISEQRYAYVENYDALKTVLSKPLVTTSAQFLDTEAIRATCTELFKR